MAEHNPPQDILLRGLRDGIVQPKQTMGRPGLRLSDVVFAAVFKVYSALSGRRAVSGIAECQSKGHIDKTPTYNSTFNYLERTSPLRAVETDFSVDSSGFSTSRFERWYDLKYGRVCSQGQWLKVHLMNGVKTHIVTSAEITASSANDSPHLPALA